MKVAPSILVVPKLRRCYRGRWRPALGILGALVWLSVSLQAETPSARPTFHASLKAATESAATDQSLVLLIFGAEWCGPCKLLKKNTLDAKEFLESAGALRIAEVDIDVDEKAARSFDVSAVPTLVLLTADGKIVARRTGYVDAKTLLGWLDTGRERVKQGQWEGVAAGSQLDTFTAKAAADRLADDDLKKLVALLAQPDPAERNAVGRPLLDQREQAVSLLIEAAADRYLGVRIAAVELLQRLAPDKITVDPWLSPAETTNAIMALKKWWAETGKLSSPTIVRSADPATIGSIKAALADLVGGDAARRTDAMSTLVAHGPAALPNVREAIKRGERTGDQRNLTVLEDVRWAILVPDPLERRVGGVRQALARGASAQRQTAATRLGGGGSDAIPALSELVNDADTLVVESAVRSLSGIGGVDSIPAMTALLKAADSNLRMTAAQALGHSKSKEAMTPLLTVVNDPNEVVAATALSALEELNSTRSYSSSRRAQSPELITALKGCLGDPRWRVRAAAAEIVGKLQAQELVPELTSLLNDADGFVTKNALGALRKVGAAPDSTQLSALARRQPGLRGEAVELLVQSATEDAVQAVIELYQNSGTEERLAVLGGLGGAGSPEGQDLDSPWKPLLAKAVTEPDVRVRRAAAEALGTQPAKLAAELVGPLLSDEDAETRASAAMAVLAVVSGERVQVRSSHETEYFPDFDSYGSPFGSPSTKKQGKTNEPPASAERIAEWSAALKQMAGLTPGLLVAAAIFVTGSSNAELASLVTAFDRADKAALARFAKSPALAAVLPRLPWPAGSAVVDRLNATPALFVATIGRLDKAPAVITDYLFEPARFRAAVESATPEDLQTALPMMLNSPGKPTSLLSNKPRVVAVVAALLESTNAGWRAAAVYSLGARNEEQHLATFEKAARDANAWVRVAAAQGIARLAKDRAALEVRLGSFVADADKNVVQMAVLGLLEPEVRSAAGLDYGLKHFRFDKVQAGYFSGSESGEQRPLQPLEGKPPFLDQVRSRLANAEPQDVALFALLLAQYGDASGLDRLVQSAGDDADEVSQLTAAAMAGIGLSRDAKYVPYLRKVTEQTKDESDYRRILQALRGVSGVEARELRLEINKRIRQAGT